MPDHQRSFARGADDEGTLKGIHCDLYQFGRGCLEFAFRNDRCLLFQDLTQRHFERLGRGFLGEVAVGQCVRASTSALRAARTAPRLAIPPWQSDAGKAAANCSSIEETSNQAPAAAQTPRDSSSWARQMASVTSVLSSSVSIIHSAPTTPGTNPASRRVETRHAKCVRHKLRPNCEQILCAARQEQIAPGRGRQALARRSDSSTAIRTARRTHHIHVANACEKETILGLRQPALDAGIGLTAPGELRQDIGVQQEARHRSTARG